MEVRLFCALNYLLTLGGKSVSLVSVPAVVYSFFAVGMETAAKPLEVVFPDNLLL